ncbi:MAG: tetratricopeptide repeat protein [Cyanobacteriota bacterium]|nr:tetratricopeptide repeat protein [Cyanobacteriota bacterium]
MLDRFYRDAITLYDAGYLSEAEEKYQEILALDNTDADAWRELGMVYYSQGRYLEALDAFYLAVELDSSTAAQYYYLGLGLAATEDFYSAISAYQQAISLDSEWSEAYHKLGECWLELGQLKEAEIHLKTAIALNSTNSEYYLDLGNLFIAQYQISSAIQTYKTALKFDSENPQLLKQLGIAFQTLQNQTQASFYFGNSAYYQAEYTKAIQYYQDSLHNQIQEVDLDLDVYLDIYLKLADCYQKVNQYSQAIQTYQQAIQQIPDAPEIYLAWIQTLQEIGEIETAINIADNALKRFPNQTLLKVAHQRLLPILYNNVSEIEYYRQRFSTLLTQLILETDLSSSKNTESLLEATSNHTNFYLQYQGYNDLELQQQYGQFIHHILEKNFPQWVQPIPQRVDEKIDSKIKIGYVSSFLNWHTVGIVFLGWLQERNTEDFEVSCYYTGNESDRLTNLYQFYSDHFYQLNGEFTEIVQKIYNDQLDILVFLDIGMCPLTTQIASLRLATVQCSAWGHPVTTGLPTIDYFISADLLEPKNAPEHYSEKLIRLPNLGIYYQQQAIPELQKTREDFGLNNNAVIYLSCQSLFKYSPQYDSVFIKISQQVTLAQFVFVSHWNDSITDKFKKRLKQSFAEFDLESEDYCIILPRLEQSDYLQLNLIADIGLDTIDFTGFLTTLDSLACNLPIVTYKGELMRSRQTAGVLQRIGVTETIAKDIREYIQIAVQLGLNPAWRQEIVNRINQNKSRLYQDRDCIQELEKFYKTALSW